MRTINDIYNTRLMAEAEEADNQGLTKIAENLTRQLEVVSVREHNQPYTYSSDSFEQDVQDALWNIVLRTADFHGTFIPAKVGQNVVDYFSEQIVDSIRKSASINGVRGAHEPNLPGEVNSSCIIDIDE
jgi:hypothetical protein